MPYDILFYVIGNGVLLHKKRSAMDAHLAERKLLLRNPLGRESVSELTLYSDNNPAELRNAGRLVLYSYYFLDLAG